MIIICLFLCVAHVWYCHYLSVCCCTYARMCIRNERVREMGVGEVGEVGEGVWKIALWCVRKLYAPIYVSAGIFGCVVSTEFVPRRPWLPQKHYALFKWNGARYFNMWIFQFNVFFWFLFRFLFFFAFDPVFFFLSTFISTQIDGLGWMCQHRASPRTNK